MPTYEYACNSCGDHLEVVQSFKDDPLTVCPACQGALRKVFQPIGIAFKGSGFYRNDSRGSSSSQSGRDKESPAKDAPAKESAKEPAKEPSSSKSGGTSTSNTAAAS